MRCSSIGCGSFDGFGLVQEQRLGFGLLLCLVPQCAVCAVSCLPPGASQAIALSGQGWGGVAGVGLGGQGKGASLGSGPKPPPPPDTTRKRLSGGGPGRAGSLFTASFSRSHAETSLLCLHSAEHSENPPQKYKRKI